MYKYEFKLKQVTPMIHFQHYESGATLRSTEVKPKLDKFLWYCIQEKNYLEDIKELVDALENEYKTNDNSKQRILLQQGKKDLPESLKDAQESEKVAFQYLLRIEAHGSVEDKTLGKSTEIQAGIFNAINHEAIKNKKVDRKKPTVPINGMYFGNMVDVEGVPTEKRENLVEKNFKETLLYKGDINCVVTADSPELLVLIKAVLPAFFLLHNFGTRQTKGFGGFEVVGSEVDEKIILKNYSQSSFLELKSDLKSQKDLSDIDFQEKMEMARGLYSLMKGGVNGRNEGSDYFKGYIFIYFFELDLGNEKSFIKQNITHRDEAKCLDRKIQNKKFVRALLGLTESYKFRVRTVSVKSLNKIQRYASPLLIKITDNSLFIIPYDNGVEIMGQSFELDGFQISVPEESFFRKTRGSDSFVEDFIESFTYYFDGIKSETYDENFNSVALKAVKDNSNRHLKKLANFTLEFVKNKKEETSK